MNALQYMANCVEQLPLGTVCELGYVHSNGQFHITKESTTAILSALHFIVNAVLQLRRVYTVRVARGARHLGRIYNASRTVLMWWQDNIDQYNVFETSHAGGGPHNYYDLRNIAEDAQSMFVQWKTGNCSS